MKFAALIFSPLAALWLASCGGNTTTTKPEDTTGPAQVYTLYSSSVKRETAKVSDGELAQLVEGNNRFALNLFHKLLAENPHTSVFSPFSVSSALAMAYAGAGGETKAQMAVAWNLRTVMRCCIPALINYPVNWLSAICPVIVGSIHRSC